MDELSERAPEEAGVRDKGRLGEWILHHDDRWLFVVLYTGLALTLSAFVSLFWLVAVVAVHGAMEWYRQRARSREHVFARVLWEVKLDLVLVLFALMVSVYMDFIVGLAGLGQAARAGARLGSRLAGWQRALRGALLSVDDAAQLGKALLMWGKKAKSAAGGEDPPEGGWRGRWSVGDRVTFVLGGVCVLLVVAAPWICSRPMGEVVGSLLRELHPWPLGR